MNKSFKPLNVHKYQKTGVLQTPDTVYWNKLSAPTYVKEFGAIEYLDFNAQDCDCFAATCSMRVQLYHPVTKTVIKTISSFQETVYGATFRPDGKMLAAGDESGCVRVFDSETRNMLRLLRTAEGGSDSGGGGGGGGGGNLFERGGAVHRVGFSLCGQKVIGFCDDHRVRLWDLANGRCFQQFNEHQDYVRAGSVNPVNENLLVSGGYDGKVVFYDTRSSEVIRSLDHGFPVESLLFLPSGGLCLSAGGTEIRVWDAFRHSDVLATISQHHKTITCLRLASNGRRFISGGLDRHVKIYDTSSLQTVHSIDFANSILSMALANDDRSLVVGTVDGIISIQNMNDIVAHEQEEFEKQEKRMRKARHRYYVGNSMMKMMESSSSTSRQMSSTGGRIHHNSLQIDHQISGWRSQRLTKYDHHLRNYAYAKCLDVVMVKTVAKQKPEVTIGVMQELIRRKGLHRALAGRSPESLSGIINFICRNFYDVRFMRVLVDVITILIELLEDSIPSAIWKMRRCLKMVGAKDNTQQLMDEVSMMDDNNHSSNCKDKKDNNNDNNDDEDDDDDHDLPNKRILISKTKDDEKNGKKIEEESNLRGKESIIESQQMDDKSNEEQQEQEEEKEEEELPPPRWDINPFIGQKLEFTLQTVNREVNLTWELLEMQGIVEMLFSAAGVNNDGQKTRITFDQMPSELEHLNGSEESS